MSLDWQQRIGNQRDWVWRGWQTRYSFVSPPITNNQSQVPLILLHGFGASIEHWRFNLPILGKERKVYALDLLGFGGSRKADIEYSVYLWVEQVYDFWQTFIQCPVILVGNSLGSLVCFAAAATHPEMVAGIVMISVPDSSLLQQNIPQWAKSLERKTKAFIAFPPLLKLIFKLVRQPRIVRIWAKVAYSQKSAVTEELLGILTAPASDRDAEKAFVGLFKGSGNSHFAPSAQDTLPKLTLPILIIWGEEDKMVPFALASPLAKLNPKIELVELEKAGHCPHDEYPKKFNALLFAWLKKYFSS